MENKKEFNLSKKKHYSEDDISMLGFHSSMTFLDIEDVREFIKRLKEELLEHCINNEDGRVCMECARDEFIIDKLAGDKLI